MFESIAKTKEQFEWVPEIMGEPHFAKASRGARVISCGMGGSNIASGFLEMLSPDLDILSHRSYGLPSMVSKNDLIIISSYSGNTEEALDSFEKAVSGGFRALAISTGGELLKRAKNRGVAFIEIPDTGTEPRMALGYSLLAMLKAVGDEENIKKAREFGEKFNPDSFEKEGTSLAEKLRGKVPVVYSSWANKAIAYAWKIKFNETAKIPAFFNVFPELNHNEMVGFEKEKPSSDNFFIFLKDSQDHPRIQKRMEVTKTMLEEKGFGVEVLPLSSTPGFSSSKPGVFPSGFEKIFNSLALADWTSYHMAKNSGFDPEDSSVIENFKNKMK